MEKKYWKGVEELSNDAEFVRQKQNEFPEALPLDEIFNSKASINTSSDRRDFLKFLGFGIAAATLAACEAPVKKTIPYLVKPEEVIPGNANWYASTLADGNDYCSILVKTREGRPIKIEGNPGSSVTKGGVNARVQAAVLGLYDNARLKGPLAAGGNSNWESVDGKIKDKLTAIAAKNGKIRILSSTIISPSTKKAIADFTTKYPTTKHVTYDAVSYSGMLEANKNKFGTALIPSYHFENANLIVSFGADFLASWLSPVEFANQYVQNRKLRGKKNMSRHIQFETALSVTGSNADKRVMIKPSEQSLAILNLYNHIAVHAGESTIKDKPVSCLKDIEATAKELWENKGKSLVVCNSNDTNTQIVVNAINSMLGNYSVPSANVNGPIDPYNPSYVKQGTDAAVMEVMSEVGKGEVDCLILYGVNPAYTAPKPDEFKKALSKVSLKISFADRADETAALCDFVCPDHHFLEAWNDAEPVKGKYSLAQPTISPLFKTRAAQESLLTWAGNNTDYHSYIQEYWKTNIHPMQNKWSVDAFWASCLQSGIFETESKSSQMPVADSKEKESKKTSSKNKKETKVEKDEPVKSMITVGVASEAILKDAPAKSDFEIVLYEKTGLGNGAQANNPWLQELPDPISKVTWDNYLAVSPKYAKDNNLESGTVVTLEANGSSITIPVLIQPGQAYGTGSVAIGYGRTNAGKTANGVGANAYPLASVSGGAIHMMAGAKFSKTSAELHQFAATQTHHTMMGRAIVKETTLSQYLKDPSSGNEAEMVVTKDGKVPSETVTLWNEHDQPNHQFGMAIDLNSCIGCGACVIGCQSENNVPVVGKDEVRRSREMHWIRIDRYFSSDMNEEKAKTDHLGEVGMLQGMEAPSENPQVVFQPVMCQHCNHAPCETVCPVAATNHSSEGMNQMAYNRCIGTRYCANNCPYKVRRFNWFKYSDNDQFDFAMNNDLGKMVLNPDVVVRSRGVMEKCSMCVQRIQEGKLNAKKESRKIKDGDIKTACQQSCPTNAIVFGDYLDPNSEVSQLKKEERAYHLLGELNVQPNVFYLTKVRNASSSEA